MSLKIKIHKNSKLTKELILETLDRFSSEGELIGTDHRNVIKILDVNSELYNIKGFKIPNAVNKIVYRFFRKSKAQRSFEYANHLQNIGIGTPQPVAYLEFLKPLTFYKSYYISEQEECDLTYRELTTDLNYPEHEKILRAFTRFTFKLHEENVNFLDHSPGNTLIKKSVEDYEFYLVDLNRMEFKTMDFETRVKNFAKLTIHESMVRTMSDEYAKCINEPFEKVFDLMWTSTQAFQEKYRRKKRLKKKLKFWKRS